MVDASRKLVHGTSPEARLAELQHQVEHLAHLLPAQGPINVFVHHNTLHTFEDLPFHEAVVKGHELFGAHPYLPEDDYRRAMEAGRIRREDVAEVLLDELDDDADTLIATFGTRYHIRLTALHYALRSGSDAELRWYMAETDALRRFREDTPSEIRERMIRETRHWAMRDLREANETSEERPRRALASIIDYFGRGAMDRWSDETWESFCLRALWRVCHQGVHSVHAHAPSAPTVASRPRDWLLAAKRHDTDTRVHDILIPFCAAYLDQGLALWTMPHRERGFFQSFSDHVSRRGGSPTAWHRRLAREFRRLRDAKTTPLESIDESLQLLGIDDDAREAFLTATLLALKGWAGMIWQLESRGDRARQPIPKNSLLEFLAVRLILDRLALADYVETKLKFTGPLARVRDILHQGRHRRAHGPSVDQRAFGVFQLAQLLGWSPAALFSMSKMQWESVVAELDTFDSMERRRIYHLSFERRYRLQVLDAITRRSMSLAPRPTVKLQLITCIDDREESFRRHLEEVEPTIETFGAAGFFAVAMYYRAVAAAHFVPLCPIVIRPKHYVAENVSPELLEIERRRGQIRKVLGKVSHRVHSNSRGVFAGAILAGFLGPLATIPMVLRVLFPRFTGRLRRRFGRFVEPPPKTILVLERTGDEMGPEPEHLGFTLDEMADTVKRLLEDIGLVSDFARLVVICGHGSASSNNPHESAYNCGACGGNRGGPNARAFALMANDPRVRARLRERGFVLPEETRFLGAYHNTCDESVIFFDLEKLPPSHPEEFELFQRSVEVARARNAHEKSRRYGSAPLTMTQEEALRHVEARSEDLSQVRPEFNHATNAVAFVGRRCRTRGLFMDRRSFLISYDSANDTAGAPILTRILQAVMPVCSGINLEYYFSTIDPVGWGCGTKLPHNITSLVGVMDGAASDLRPGLSAQMVEIHEPVRLLFVIETTPEIMTQIMADQPVIRRLCQNQWIQLAVLDPESPAIHVYRDGRFVAHDPEFLELRIVSRSADWYRGWRDHLGFALIAPAGGAN